MPLWGSNTTITKPKYLSDRDKARTYATSTGWVLNRDDGTQETLVALGNLTTSLGNAAPTSAYFANAAAVYVQGATNAHVAVSFSENVKVTGAPTLVVQGSSTNATATYASGNNTNILLFKFTVPASTQTLSIKGQTIAVNSTVTIVEVANNSTNAIPTFANSIVVGLLAVNGANSQVAVA